MDYINSNFIMMFAIICIIHKGAKAPYDDQIIQIKYCIAQIRLYFGDSMDVRELAAHALTMYTKTDPLNPYAKSYYNLIGNHIYRGDVPAAEKFCKLRRFGAICKKWIAQLFDPYAGPSVKRGFYEYTTEIIQQKHLEDITDYWESITKHFGIVTGHGFIQNPVDYCIHIKGIIPYGLLDSGTNLTETV